MTRTITTTLCLAAVLATGACSTKPRQFSAQVRPLAETSQLASIQQSESGSFTTCDQMVRKGRKSGFASAAATGGAGIAGVAGGAGLAFTGLGGGSLASAGATAAAAMPVIGLVAAFGMNRAIRGGRERGYRKHMTACMDEMGYQVIDWTRAAKKQRGTASLSPDSRPPSRESAQAAAILQAAPVIEPAAESIPADGEVQAPVVPPAPVG